MQNENDIQKFTTGDPTWFSMGDFLLGEVTSDEERIAEHTVGPLFQAIRELGLPPEDLKRIEGTIKETIRGAKSPLDHSVPDLPVRIILFSKIKTMDCVEQSDEQMYRGWGYYVIERSRDFLNTPCQKLCLVVELYLYNESK